MKVRQPAAVSLAARTGTEAPDTTARGNRKSPCFPHLLYAKSMLAALLKTTTQIHALDGSMAHQLPTMRGV